MKRVLVVGFIVILLATFILFTFSFNSIALDSIALGSQSDLIVLDAVSDYVELDSKPGYIEKSITYFNSKYYYSSSDYIFPTGLTGVNYSLYSFYPFIIGMEDRYIFIFAKDYSYSLSEGTITLNLVNSFIVTSNIIGLFDVSTVTKPTSLHTLSYTYSLDEVYPSLVRDQFGHNVSLIYLPIFEDITAQTGLTCYNNFPLPLYTAIQHENEVIAELTSSVSSEESYDFSYDVFSYAGEGYSYDADTFSDALDVQGALDGLDGDIDDAKSVFHQLFSILSDSLNIGLIITILLIVSFAYFVLGRL